MSIMAEFSVFIIYPTSAGVCNVHGVYMRRQADPVAQWVEFHVSCFNQLQCNKIISKIIIISGF